MNLITPISPLSIATNWPTVDVSTLPAKGDKLFTKQQELMKELVGWYKTEVPGFALGGGQVAGPTTAKVEKAEVKKEEKKSEVFKFM